MFKKTVDSRKELNEVLDALDVLEKGYTVTKETNSAEKKHGLFRYYSWTVEEIVPGDQSKKPSVCDLTVTVGADLSQMEEVTVKIKELLDRPLSDFVSVELGTDA
ncbi:hypothetical protein D3C87_1130600 [compost metagenome]